MDKLKHWWGELDAKRRQMVLVGGVTISVFGFLFIIMDNTEIKTTDPNQNRVVAARDIVTQTFTGANTREMDMHGMAAQMREMNKTIKSVGIKYDRMVARNEVRDKNQQTALGRAVHEAKANLAKQTMTLLEKKYGEDFTDVAGINDRINIALEDAALAAEKALTLVESKAPAPKATEAFVSADQYQMRHRVDWENEASKSDSQPADSSEPTKKSNKTKPILNIVVDNRKSTDDQEEATEAFYLPGNTILQGVLLTGAVVPVGKGSKENPVPILMRIKDDAILANNFRADIKECFLSASGTGDLSSERVEFRSERLVCIKDDGGVLESNVEMWSVGEDGMAGVRGVLVHRAGSLVAQGALAATVDSFAQMFAMVPVPTLNTTSSTETVYQQALSQDSLQGASVQGLSGGLTRLTDYLMDLADQILPVLEVHALREVSFVMVKGQKLEFTESVAPSGLN